MARRPFYFGSQTAVSGSRTDRARIKQWPYWSTSYEPQTGRRPMFARSSDAFAPEYQYWRQSAGIRPRDRELIPFLTPLLSPMIPLPLSNTSVIGSQSVLSDADGEMDSIDEMEEEFARLEDSWRPLA